VFYEYKLHGDVIRTTIVKYMVIYVLFRNSNRSLGLCFFVSIFLMFQWILLFFTKRIEAEVEFQNAQE
jgi:hypothetical protein